MPLENGQVSTRSRKILERFYYDRGYTYGRDALHHLLMRRLPDTHPSKEEIELWLKQQKLQQLYRGQRKGGVTNRFHPTKPWRQTSIDLIDYNFKQSGNMRYIIVFVDNFSRYMYTKGVTGKTAPKVAAGFRDILEKFKKEFPKANIETMVADDGGEFKGDFIKVLQDNDITKRKILGGHPQQNSLVERSNGKLKMLLAKNRAIKGGGWASHLANTTHIYNDMLNRGIDAAPAEAVKYTSKAQFKTVRKHNKKVYKITSDAKKKSRELVPGAKVRLALAKGALSKSSAPQWTEKIYKIQKVIPARGSMAAKYTITGKDQDFKYTRNDVQLIDKDVEDIPAHLKKKKKDNDTNVRVLRSIVPGGWTQETVKKKEEKEAEAKKLKAMTDDEKIKKFVGKRVMMPDGSDDAGDLGKIQKGERRELQVTKKVKGKKVKQVVTEKRLFFRVKWDDGYVNKDTDNWYSFSQMKKMRDVFLKQT
jgi:transposase InsO family protein